MILNCLINYSIFQNSNKILWSDNRKLEWKQFRGNVDGTSLEGAATKTRIEINVIAEKTYIEFNVPCYFEPNQSWTLTNDSAVLIHEQNHFNLAEVAARNLRKELSEFKYVKGMNIKSEVNILYHKNIKFLITYQNKYDTETNHSISKHNQKIWEQRITDLLMNLEKYKATTIRINLS